MTPTAWLVAMFLITARNCEGLTYEPPGHRYKDYRGVTFCWGCGLRKDAIETATRLGMLT